MTSRAKSSRLADANAVEPAVQTVGLIQIGAARVALPAESIREVLEGQPRYGTLPIKAQGLLGAMDIRGTIVPILDLRPILGWPDDGEGGHVIVILRCDGNLLGLRAEAVFGIMEVQPGDLCDLIADGSQIGEILATKAFVCDEGIIAILDPSRITNRPGLPKVVEKIERREVVATMSSETVLLFSHGRAHLGIAANCIDATVPDVAIQKNALSAGFCLGTIDHRGYHVPVVDTIAAVGLGLGSRPSTSTVVVIRFGANSMVGLAVDSVRDIVPVAPGAILAMPMLNPERTSLFRGMLLGEAAPHHLLINVDTFRRHPDLVDLAHLCRPRLGSFDHDAVGRHVAYENVERFIIYRAGGECATRLEQITEVLPFPTDVVPFEAERGVLGLFVHRGRLAPLICLDHVLTERNHAIDEAEARVLFVEAGQRSAGFVVDMLVSIDTADPAQWSAARARGQSSLMGFPFVMLGDRRCMVSHIDLVALMDRVHGAGGSMKDAEPADLVRREGTVAFGVIA